MLTLAIKNTRHYFSRYWKLYVSNTVFAGMIIFLFSFLGGAQRQLERVSTAFNGEAVVTFTDTLAQLAERIPRHIPYVSSVKKRLTAHCTFKIPHTGHYLRAEMLGVEAVKETGLVKGLFFVKGGMIENTQDIVIPSSFLRNSDISTGDRIVIKGKTAHGVINMAAFTVRGVYKAPDIFLFAHKPAIVDIKAMERFYQPSVAQYSYCFFFNERGPRDNMGVVLNNMFKDEDVVRNVTIHRISSFDFTHIPRQFNIFLGVLVVLTILSIMSVVVVVNFSIYVLMFRNRYFEIGALKAFGVPVWKVIGSISLEVILQSTIAIVVAIALNGVAAFMVQAHFLPLSKPLEVLFLLTSGSGTLVLDCGVSQCVKAFLVLLCSAFVAVVPIIVHVSFLSPKKLYSSA